MSLLWDEGRRLHSNLLAMFPGSATLPPPVPCRASLCPSRAPANVTRPPRRKHRRPPPSRTSPPSLPLPCPPAAAQNPPLPTPSAPPSRPPRGPPSRLAQKAPCVDYPPRASAARRSSHPLPPALALQWALGSVLSRPPPGWDGPALDRGPGPPARRESDLALRSACQGSQRRQRRASA